MEHEIILKREKQVNHATIGRLFINNKDECFILEDQHRNIKIKGQTRIPAGRYLLQYRKEGGFHERFKKRFPKMHKGMIEITGIPNFVLVLIHTGNTIEDTMGCLLTGNSMNFEIGAIPNGASTPAYEHVYPIITSMMDECDTYIVVKDEGEK